MKITELLAWLDSQNMRYTYNGSMDVSIRGFSSLTGYKKNTLTWIKKEENYNQAGRPAEIDCAVVQKGIKVDFPNAIETENAKEVFFSILRQYWGNRKKAGFCGRGTVLSESAQIDPSVSIGCNCCIEAGVRIGADTVIEHNVTIGPHVTIGSGCVIHSGTVIGADGFGYCFREDGEIEKAEHFGSVIIGHDVEIGANVCIDRGTIDNTVIGDHSKIDNLVHIAHNVQIGKSVCVVAGAVICGSVILDDGAYVAPGGIVKNQLQIGRNGFVGLGAVVTHSVEKDTVVAGIPAKPVRKIRKGDK